MPITAPPDIIHPYEPIPNPNQGRAAFNTNMQETFDRWPLTSASQEELADWMESAANAAESSANLAAEQVTAATTAKNESQASAAASAASANISAAAANMLGTWTAYGANPIAAFEGMIKHAGSYWVPLVNLADASSVEPGTDANTWEDYIALVSGGIEVVTSAADTTGARVTDVDWLKSRGIGGAHDASGRTFTAPSNLAGLGFIAGLCDGETLGIEDLESTDYGTLTIEATSADTSIANSVSLTFKRAGAGWIRSNVDATTWGDWTRIGTGSGGGLTEPALDLGNVATSASQTVTLDCGVDKIWVMSMNTANTTGTLNIELTNLPDTATGVYVAHIFLIRGGRKTVSFSLPGGFTLGWIQGVAPTLSNDSGVFDLISIRKELGRTRLKAAVVDSGVW